MQDVDPESTAVDDTYGGIIGNVGLNVPAGNGLLANDLGGPANVTAVNGGANVGIATATTHGTVTVQADGSFLYEPDAGNLTADSFTYELDTATTATVNLTFGTDLVWFIDVTPSGAGNEGTLSDPFTSIADYHGVAAAGDKVFIAEGSYTGPLNLNNNTIVIGEGASGTTASLLGVTEPTDSRTLPGVGGTAPVITSAGNGINLASGNTIRGVDIGNTTGTGISGVSVGTATVSDVSITGTGAGVNIITGTLAMSFDEISSSNAAGITLSGVGGDFDVTTGTIDSGNSTAVSISGNPIDLGVTLGSVSSNGATNGIVLSNTTGSFTVTGDGGSSQNGSGGSILNSTGDAISLTTVTNISLDQMTVDDIGGHGVFGTGVVNLSISNSTFEDIGDVANEDAFSFRTQTGGTDNNLSGTFTLDNVDVTRFHDTGVHIYNETGTLTANIINDSDFSDNDDTNGVFGINVETEGDANMTLLINGSDFDNIESNIVRYDAGSTGINDVTILNSTSVGGGGPNDFPNGGGIELQANNSSSTTFDIRSNTLVDMRGDIVRIVSSSGNGNFEGRIGGPNASDGNTLSGSAQGDGIHIENFSHNATGIEVWTILVQNNEIGIDTSGIAGGPFNGIGDDGIQINIGDHDGISNITIADNQLGNIASEGIKTFFDDDLAGGTNPDNRLSITDNTFTSITSGQGIEHDTRDTAETCLHIAGNTLGTAEIIIDVRDSSTATISQANVAALSAANGGATVIEQNNGISGFNVPCNPVLPGAPLLLESEPGLVAGGVLLDALGLSHAISEAHNYWTRQGISQSQQSQLANAEYFIRDLADGVLGRAFRNTVYIDSNAAGIGWQLGSGLGIDLVDVLTHELGHVLGFDDVYDSHREGDVMYGIRSPSQDLINASRMNGFDHALLLGSSSVDRLMSDWDDDDLSDSLGIDLPVDLQTKRRGKASPFTGTIDLIDVVDRLRQQSDGESAAEEQRESEEDTVTLLAEGRS
ncbi:hypothetical protein RMSM_02290 [Rhodopirellula maiorica SM1]|uniref:Right handed beta helix domain-containing protein n=1 Tax=Rhodopirellula maiorica SM1 TaxID=1265738 RepID=M5RZG3_9BACT|nr:hypothetical protein RMSM_02290 [Rhodopirellula maiorica SM1]